MNPFLRFCIVIIFLAGSAGCASQVLPLGGSADAYPVFSTPTQVPYPLNPTDSPYPAPTTALCAYQWATLPLPELTDEVQAAVTAAGLTGVTVNAGAFGENCLGENGQVLSFGEMQTDFWITVAVADLADTSAHADRMAELLTILTPFSPENTPGPQPGRLWFRFIEGEEEMNLSVPWNDGQDVLALGLTGQAAWDEILSRQLP